MSDFLHANHLDPMGWMLVHSLWLLLIPAALLAIALLITPSTWSRFRYSAGLLALLAMAAAPVLALQWVPPATPTEPVVDAAAINEPVLSPVVVDEQPDTQPEKTLSLPTGEPSPAQIQPGVSVVLAESELPPNVELSNEPVTDSIDVATEAAEPTTEEAVAPTAAPRFTDRIRPWLPLLVVSWLIGVVLMMFRLLLGWWRTRQLDHVDVSSAPDRVQSLFNELRNTIVGSKTVKILQSSLVTVPAVVGHFRPIVLLPVSAVTGLSEQQLRAILAHELAHVKRCDYAVNVVQSVIESVLFYHPAVWWVSKIVRAERENCCDDIAVTARCQPADLATALVKVNAAAGGGPAAVAPAADGGDLLKRIRRLAGSGRQDPSSRKSWLAGVLVLVALLSVSVTTMSPPSEANADELNEVPISDTDDADDADDDANDDTNDADGTAGLEDIESVSRIEFEGGYFVELFGVSDNDVQDQKVWNTDGEIIEEPFAGAGVLRTGVKPSEMARGLFVRSRLPLETAVTLQVAGRSAPSTGSNTWSENEFLMTESSAIVVFPAQQKTADVEVQLTWPAWRTVASFDFAGGVNNGIRLKRDRKVSPQTVLRATGDFGKKATAENTRIIAFDRQHKRLKPIQQGSSASEDGLTELRAGFENEKGRPQYIVVQRRTEARPIVFRNVPLQPGQTSSILAEIRGALRGTGGSGAGVSGSRIVKRGEKPLPLSTLLEDPAQPLSATFPGVGRVNLIGVRQFGDDGPGWLADGSTAVTPIDVELWSGKSRIEAEDKQHLEVLFEFQPEDSGVEYTGLEVRADDGKGMLLQKPVVDDGQKLQRVRASYSLEVFNDRETDDFFATLFAGPWETLHTLEISDPEKDRDKIAAFLKKPTEQPGGLATVSGDPELLENGKTQQSYLVYLPKDSAIDAGVRPVGITTKGERLTDVSHFRPQNYLVATFNLNEGQQLKAIEVQRQPKHSIVFRNVSLWPGLGSAAFIDVTNASPAAEFEEQVAASRIFLRPNGERFAEDSEAVDAVKALQEIERRGGLFRFDATAETPAGIVEDTLPYLTEIRWDGCRDRDLALLKPLAGLTRLKLASHHLTDDGLVSLEHLADLQELEVAHTSRLTTKCLHSIGKLKALRELVLPGSLSARSGKYAPEDFNALTGLERLKVFEPDNWRLDDAGLLCLKNADDLEMVYCFGPDVTDVGFAALANKPKLGVIHLNETKITDASFKLLENHPQLYWLQCTSPNLTDAAIDSAITLPRLRDLHLFGSQVTDAGVDRLIAALDKLPKLQTVNLSKTQVTSEAAHRLRAARKGLRVLGGNDKEKVQKTTVKAPTDVPWPTEKHDWFADYPASGTGLRVKLDDQRWVELNSIVNSIHVNDGKRVFWKPDGTLINAPDEFDPNTLIPKSDADRRTSEVEREVALQIVAPKESRFSLSSGGAGGYGNMSVPVDDHFIQFPIQYPVGSLQKNHTYVEVKISRQETEKLELYDPQIHVLTEPNPHQLLILVPDAKDYAWSLAFEVNGRVEMATPSFTGSSSTGRFSPVPKEIQEDLPEQFQDTQVVGFSFDKQRPMPNLLWIKRSRYDVVRFDNIAVYPGPKSAVKVSVNGVPVSEEDRLVFSDSQQMPPITPPVRPVEKIQFIDLEGTVVDANGDAVKDCWVGMFVDPQESTRPKKRSTFGPQSTLVTEAKTGPDGQFKISAPKDHFVFEGSFWAVQDDGTSGAVRLNCTWGHLKENLKIKLADAVAEVKVVDPDGNPVAGVRVTPEQAGKARSPAYVFPAEVRRKLTSTTDEAGTVRFHGWATAGLSDVAIATEDYGTQYCRNASFNVKAVDQLLLTLRPTASISGSVLGFDLEKDNGLQLQFRTEQWGGPKPFLNGRAIVNVADDGSFHVPRLLAGRVSIDSSVGPNSFRKIRLKRVAQLEPGEERQFANDDMPEMVQGVRVRQRMVKSDTGEPCPNVSLRVLWGAAVTGNGSWNTSKETRTNADGWWEAIVLPGKINARIGIPQGYRGTAWFDGRNGYLGVEHIVPPTDEVVTLPPERYLPAKEMPGQLLLPDGKPAVGWMAYGHPVSWNDVGVGGVNTDRKGEFTWTYPEGYPPRLFKVSNRKWLTDHKFTDDYAYPKVVSEDPLVLQIPATE